MENIDSPLSILKDFGLRLYIDLNLTSKPAFSSFPCLWWFTSTLTIFRRVHENKSVLSVVDFDV